MESGFKKGPDFFIEGQGFTVNKQILAFLIFLLTMEAWGGFTSIWKL